MKAKWGALCCALIVGLAAGIGIGLVLPRLLQTCEGSKFFRQVLEDSGPAANGSTLGTPLGHRVSKGTGAEVFRSAPETSTDTDGRSSRTFQVVIRGTFLGRQVFLRELAEYLKETASATGVEEVSIKDHITDGNKDGFSFGYKTPSGTGEEGKAVLYDHKAGLDFANAVIIMQVRERK